MRIILLLSFLFFLQINIQQAQDTIRLQNSSFEWSSAIKNVVPMGWQSCGGKSESPPDVHSNMTRHYKVIHAPQKGKKYLGLVVRSNFTKEAISQQLEKPIQKNKIYKMELYLAKAENFISMDKNTMRDVAYITPAVLRIWGIEKDCSTRELLFESNPINHKEWKKIMVQFSPKMKHEHIMFEAFFDKMKEDPYNGNLLLDNISPIFEIKN